jgi:L-amino acid N-acyltransferase YncA
VLESEYEKRRRPAPALATSQQTHHPRLWVHDPACHRAEDFPHTLALYRHWVRNSVVTFDETPPSLRTYRSRFATTKNTASPTWSPSPRRRHFRFCDGATVSAKVCISKNCRVQHLLRPCHHRKRSGEALLAALIDACEAAGIREIIAVIADQGAEASLALHEKFGFVETGRMQKVGYKFERWVGIILMQKSLRVKK